MFKMRKILLFISAFFSAGLSYAADNPSDGKALLEYCNAAVYIQENWDSFQNKTGDDFWEPLVKARYCQGIVKGILGTAYGFQKAGIADNSCMPENLSVDQAIKDVVEYINSVPETAYKQKDVVVIQEALILKYMCN